VAYLQIQLFDRKIEMIFSHAGLFNVGGGGSKGVYWRPEQLFFKSFDNTNIEWSVEMRDPGRLLIPELSFMTNRVAHVRLMYTEGLITVRDAMQAIADQPCHQHV